MGSDSFRPNSAHVTWDHVPAATKPQDCFADEIAIDFPSVDHVVQRMREAFLGEDADGTVLSAELQLSSVEARRGLVVPLSVPVGATCNGCGGRGETWTEPCDTCSGTGQSLVHHPVRVSVPPGVPDGARFRFRLTPRQAESVCVELRVAIRSSAA